MDPKIIQQLTEAIGSQLSSHLPTIIAFQFLVTLIAAGVAVAVGSFLSEYFKNKGKTLATKADFDELQRQLKKQTDLVETIRSDISQRDWAKREWQTFRRGKLESLIEKYQDCLQYLELHRANSIAGKFTTERDSITELDTIATNFAELNKEVSDFAIPGRDLIVAGSLLVRDLLLAGNDTKQREDAYDKYQAALHLLYAKYKDAGEKLTTAAYALMLEIMKPPTP